MRCVSRSPVKAAYGKITLESKTSEMVTEIDGELGDPIVDDPAVNIGESEVSTCVAIGKLLVVKTQ